MNVYGSPVLIRPVLKVALTVMISSSETLPFDRIILKTLTLFPLGQKTHCPFAKRCSFRAYFERYIISSKIMDQLKYGKDIWL
jgi:hypothetical protein